MATESAETSKLQSLCSVCFKVERILGGCAHSTSYKDKGNIFAWLALMQTKKAVNSILDLNLCLDFETSCENLNVV